MLLFFILFTGCTSISSSKHNLIIKSGNYDEFLRYIKSGGNKDRVDSLMWTPLHYSIRFDRRKMFDYLICNGANTNLKDSLGKTPLNRAVIMRNAYYTEKLLLAGALTDIKDNHGLIELQYAVWNGDSEIVEQLLKHSIKIDIQTEKTSLLHIACMNSHERVAILLIEREAELNGLDENSKTPLDISIALGDENIIDALRESGAKTAEELKAEEEK